MSKHEHTFEVDASNPNRIRIKVCADVFEECARNMPADADIPPFDGTWLKHLQRLARCLKEG